MKEKSIKDLVLEESNKGNVVFKTIEGICTAKLDDFISQPVEGILYDLHRDFGTILTQIDDIKWVNDYALSKVVMELSRRLEEANKKIAELEESHK